MDATRWLRGAAVLGAAMTLSGCALLQSDPVPEPPPPPDTVDTAGADEPERLEELVQRNEDGDVQGVAPLQSARDAVAEAGAAEAVSDYAADELAEAESVLERAESQWADIRDAPMDEPDVLSQVAHTAHQARRWAEIALAIGDREMGLRRLAEVQAALERRDAADARWVGRKLVPGDMGEVRFAPGTAQLTDGSQAVVEELAGFLQEHPRYALRLVGHTDDTAPSAANLDAFLESNQQVADRTEDAAARAAAYNQAMSERRARALRSALIDAGIAPERLNAAGRGAEEPVADNDTASGRRQNRRVEAIVLLPGSDQGA